MHRRANNGLGIALLVAIMAVTPLVPAAMSVNPPQWTWDAEGRVSDASGQFRSLTEQEACEMYDICRRPQISVTVADQGASGSGGEGPDGGGCK